MMSPVLVHFLFLALAVEGVDAVAHQEGFEWTSRLGVIFSLKGRIYFATTNPNLSERPSIMVVAGEGTEVMWVQGEAHKVQDNTSREQLILIEGGSSLLYELYISKSIRLPSGPGFGILMSPREPGGNRASWLHLDADNVPEFFYQCTSREGLHLIVRSGDRLSGQTRWRAYYYLGYDVEPTCREEDFR